MAKLIRNMAKVLHALTHTLADSSMQLALPVFFYWPKVHNTLLLL